MVVSAAVFVPGGLEVACRWTKVKLNMRSSSFESLRRKDGSCEAVPLSGSCHSWSAWPVETLRGLRYLNVLDG
jgi:hypothetical protein